jgi:TolB-like protein/DNA-binding winged helix-turn-helix (wHTH) protein
VIFRFGEYELDSGCCELRKAGERVSIEPKVFDLLLHLVRERTRLVRKSELLAAVWPDVQITESTLTRAVSLARAAVGDSAQAPGVIETVSARGYRWIAPVEVVEAPPLAPAAGTLAPRARGLRVLGSLAAPLVLLASLAFAWPRPVGWLFALTGTASPPAAPSPTAQPSVVVLPFVDLGADDRSAHLADGITEDLTIALARFPTLFVISRSSAYVYRDRKAPPGTIGRELGVRYLVEGSVRSVGGRLAVTSQLVEAQTGVQVWADRFDAPEGDLFAVQERLAEQIVSALAGSINHAELERLRERATDDLDAYELYVEARAAFHAYRLESHARARELVARALAIDPDFPLAVSLAAALELTPYQLGWDLDPGRLARARALATHALALDPSSPAPHMTLAQAYGFERRFDQALEEASRAVALGPSYDVCHAVQAQALLTAGRPLDALRALDRALRLNPRHPAPYWLMAGLIQLAVKRDDLAVELMERVHAANPDMIPAQLALAFQYQHVWNQPERVPALGREILRVNPKLTAEQALLVFPYAATPPGVREKALVAFRAAGLE